MTDKQSLLALAASCEAASRLGEASAIIAAHDAIFPEPPSNYQPRATPSFAPEWSEWSTRMCAVRNFVQFGAHMDAALMLVPEGWCWTVNTFAEPIKSASAYLIAETNKMVRPERQYIATPALALCAASLRARAGAGG